MAENIQTTLDTEQVSAIALQIENDNNLLKETLENTKATIDALSATWTGQAADETRASYTEFANKFFQEYYDVLEQYVKFLRKNVVEGYNFTEKDNVGLAALYKS